MLGLPMWVVGWSVMSISFCNRVLLKVNGYKRKTFDAILFLRKNIFVTKEISLKFCLTILTSLTLVFNSCLRGFLE